jgi:hypothetical protein
MKIIKNLTNVATAHTHTHTHTHRFSFLIALLCILTITFISSGGNDTVTPHAVKSLDQSKDIGTKRFAQGYPSTVHKSKAKENTGQQLPIAIGHL